VNGAKNKAGLMTSTVMVAKTASLWASLARLRREEMAEDIEARWGFLPDYQREPNCGCEKVCKFKQRIKQKHEQQADPARAKAPRRR
jgi:hypothetical protein